MRETKSPRAEAGIFAQAPSDQAASASRMADAMSLALPFGIS